MRQGKVMQFFKRNAAYAVLGLCVLAIGLSITMVMLNRADTLKTEDDIRQSAQISQTIDPEPVPNMPGESENPAVSTDVPVAKVINFIMPVTNVSGVEDYSETLTYNSTLKRYQAHKAIDFFAEEGAPVYAAYDGVISDVSTTLLTGTTVTIDHGNGLFTVYNSLADGEKVFVGQSVKQGAEIGEVSVSNRQEAVEGAHLHFQVIEDGQVINPAKYMVQEDK